MGALWNLWSSLWTWVVDYVAWWVLGLTLLAAGVERVGALRATRDPSRWMGGAGSVAVRDLTTTPLLLDPAKRADADVRSAVAAKGTDGDAANRLGQSAAAAAAQEGAATVAAADELAQAAAAAVRRAKAAADAVTAAEDAEAAAERAGQIRDDARLSALKVVADDASRAAKAANEAAAVAADEVTELEHWRNELVNRRRSYLADVRVAAGNWRTVFSALLGVFAIVTAFAGKDGFGLGAGVDRGPVVAAVMVTLVAALNAIFYTGWAATGMPIKFYKQTSGEGLRDAEFNHATRSRVRLRVGLVCGALSLIGATVAVWLVLTSA